MAAITITETFHALKTSSMADAIILQTVVPLAVTALTNSLRERSQLLHTSLHSLWSIIVLTPDAGAPSIDITRHTSLEAHTVELATLATLTVASTRLRRRQTHILSVL